MTSRKKDFFAGQEGGRRYLPYAFTEQGIYMLATVLRGKLAEQQSIFIMRTFREMRHYIRQNQQFVTRNEMNLLTAKVGTITERQNRMENKVDSIQKDVNILADNFITDKDKKNFVIYKGIMQIELRTYKYVKYGVVMERYYVVLRCNPSIIMGDSKVFLVDLTRYTLADILDRLLKRIYEINEFRYIRLDKQPLSLFLMNRADIAEDIQVDFPQLVIWLCNMSFHYGYRNMKRTGIDKDIDSLYIESCCFSNGSRAFNIYHKWIALINTGKEIPTEEQEQIQRTVRLEAQIKKQGIYNMKLPTKRSVEPFLEKDFCHEYLKKEIRNIFCIEKYVSRSKAVELINNSSYKTYDKAVMVSIIDMIQHFKGLYELEKAIADTNIYTPPQYGNIT